MRMRVSGVDLEVAQLLLAERPVLQHAGHGVPERIGWVLDDHVAVGTLPKTTRVAGIARVHLVSRLLPGHPDALDVDDDHMIARVQVRRVHRLFLAPPDPFPRWGKPGPRPPPCRDDV